MIFFPFLPFGADFFLAAPFWHFCDYIIVYTGIRMRGSKVKGMMLSLPRFGIVFFLALKPWESTRRAWSVGIIIRKLFMTWLWRRQGKKPIVLIFDAFFHKYWINYYQIFYTDNVIISYETQEMVYIFDFNFIYFYVF